MGKTDTVDLHVDLLISKRWVPAFVGFLSKLQKNSTDGHSSLVGFFADGDGDFNFQAHILPSENKKFMDEFGRTNYRGERVVDRDKAIGKPVCKNVDVPNLYCLKVEEVYDAG